MFSELFFPSPQWSFEGIPFPRLQSSFSFISSVFPPFGYFLLISHVQKNVCKYVQICACKSEALRKFTPPPWYQAQHIDVGFLCILVCCETQFDLIIWLQVWANHSKPDQPNFSRNFSQCERVTSFRNATECLLKGAMLNTLPVCPQQHFSAPICHLLFAGIQRIPGREDVSRGAHGDPAQGHPPRLGVEPSDWFCACGVPASVLKAQLPKRVKRRRCGDSWSISRRECASHLLRLGRSWVVTGLMLLILRPWICFNSKRDFPANIFNPWRKYTLPLTGGGVLASRIEWTICEVKGKN